MNVLSLFDGISCARVALERAGIRVKTYYASEIDKHAIAISTKNYPDIVRLGDVRSVTTLPEPIDLLIGGSPCQDLSIAKKGRKGLAGDRSSLFWEYVRIKEALNPKWFVLENVASMSRGDRQTITDILRVEPILIDASLVSAQSRKRLFWTNISNIKQPEDKGILLKDILQPDADVDDRFLVNGKSFCLTASYSKTSQAPKEKEVNHEAEKRCRTLVFHKTAQTGLYYMGHLEGSIRKGMEGQEHLSRSHPQCDRVYGVEGKSPTLAASETSGRTHVVVGRDIRKLTPIECERLQCLPDNYTEGVAITHRYKALGNAFNVDVVAHILRSAE